MHVSRDVHLSAHQAPLPRPLLPSAHPLPPLLHSLVKKDAGMLDAFGKGASSDIQLAKQELYAQAGRGLGWAL